MRSLEVGENPVRKVRLGQFSARVAEGGAARGRPERASLPTGSSTAPTACGSCSARAPSPRRRTRRSPRMRTPEPEPLALARRRSTRRRRGPLAIEPLVMPALPEPQAPAAAPAVDAAAPRAGQHRPGLRSDGRPRHADQPRLQGRRPAGHLPAVLGHLGPQRGREPGRHRQGDAEAQRGALGTRARADPEDERPRLRARGQRDPHRAAHRPPARGGATGASSTRRRRSPAT